MHATAQIVIDGHISWYSKQYQLLRHNQANTCLRSLEVVLAQLLIVPCHVKERTEFLQIVYHIVDVVLEAVYMISLC